MAPSGVFYPLGASLRFERRLHSATLIDKTRVLIAGGASDTEVLASAEILNIPPGANSPPKCEER